jgi:hypothetical protein
MQLLLGEPAHAAQHRFGEFLADDRRRLQHVFVARREAVDAGGEHRLHRGRHRGVVDGTHKTIRALDAGERAVLRQRLHQLFDEEGIAAATGGQPNAEIAERDIGAEQLGEQLADSRLAKGLQGNAP